MQAYSLYPEDLRMLFATFLSEFHGATLWHGDAPDLILMAPSPPSGEILKRAQDLFEQPRLHEDFAQLGHGRSGWTIWFLPARRRRFAEIFCRRANQYGRSNVCSNITRRDPCSSTAWKTETATRFCCDRKIPCPNDFPPEARDAALAASAATSVNQEDADGAERFLQRLDNRPVNSWRSP